MSVGTEMRQDRIPAAMALDKSVRRVDQDGHLFIETAILSASDVCPYRGDEIPDWQDLGLKADRVYQLYRDADSLAAAASSINGKPILMVHQPISADDHPHEIVVGAVGSDAHFTEPSLTNSLSIWAAEGVEAIESGQMRSVSAGYRYTPVMEPGTHNGIRYDGKMIVESFNHLALVVEPRVKTAVIGDSALKPTPNRQEILMATSKVSRQALLATGALRAYLRSKLATDAKIDLNPILSNVTGKTWKADKPRIKVALDAAVVGKLAQDADLEDITDMLDQLEEMSDEEVAANATDAKPDDQREGESDEDYAKRKKAEEAKDKGAKDDKPETVTKSAMDSAIAAATAIAAQNATSATIARLRAIQAAERDVRPFIGEIAVAQDSAPAVYKLALDHLGVDLTGVPAEGYGALLRVMPKPDERPVRIAPIAQDAAAVTERHKRFPHANRLATN